MEARGDGGLQICSQDCLHHSSRSKYLEGHVGIGKLAIILCFNLHAHRKIPMGDPAQGICSTVPLPEPLDSQSTPEDKLHEEGLLLAMSSCRHDHVCHLSKQLVP